ncbi:phage tail tape measure protein, partial [Pseudomonas syringae pv. actinidiae ICMP 19070]
MADTDVQGMLVRIEATTAQLRQELTRSEGSVSSTAHNIDQSLGRIDNAFDRVNASAQTVGRAVTSAFDQIGAGNLAAAGSIAGLVALTTSTIDYAKEVKNLSALSNTTVEDFQRMAFGAKTVGVEQDKLGDILKDTNDRVGEFLQRGGGEMSDFFKEIAPKIGVTAGQFANLSGPQALQLYYTSLEKAGLNQQQMTTYMEAMADETTALIPLLRNNGKGFKEWGDQAERAGSVISEFNVNRLVAAGQAISGLKATFSGAANQITIGLLPGIESITKSLQGLSDNGGAKRLGETISFLAENVDVLVAALGGKMAAFAIDAVASSATATKAMLTNIATTKASAIAKAEETAASAASAAAKLRESVAAYSAAQALEAEAIARLAQVQ